MTHDLIATGLLVWLAGALVGWGVGWAARSEQNRGWQAGTRRQLDAAHATITRLHDELDDALDALDALDHARAEHHAAALVAARVPTVVQIHLAAVTPLAGQHPAVIAAHPIPIGDATPVLPAPGDPS